MTNFIRINNKINEALNNANPAVAAMKLLTLISNDPEIKDYHSILPLKSIKKKYPTFFNDFILNINELFTSIPSNSENVNSIREDGIFVNLYTFIKEEVIYDKINDALKSNPADKFLKLIRTDPEIKDYHAIQPLKSIKIENPTFNYFILNINKFFIAFHQIQCKL